MSTSASWPREVAAAILLVGLSLLAASCASPPLSIYTLEPSNSPSQAAPLTSRALVIEIRRVVIPDSLDTQDILIRDGSTLQRSSHGRWASRLSLGITRYLTGLLAARRPDALVTDQPQPEAPNDRIFVAISTFDVTSAGVATLEADWTIVPRNPAQPTRRQRARFTATGPVATDQDVVALMQTVLTQLADAMDIAKLR
jgi:uncharacterized lipoprotein YmbA